MEIPSFFYMQSLAESIQLLTNYVQDRPEYIRLQELGCIFLDSYILYDKKTKSQFEFDRYYINYDRVKDFNRLNQIIVNYTELITYIHKIDKATNCIRRFKDINLLRHAFYKQMIRERVYNHLPVYWHNMNGNWKIKFTEFEAPWGYYDLYRLTDRKRYSTGKGRMERLQLYLTEDDVKKERYNVMMCEQLFEQMRKELPFL